MPIDEKSSPAARGSQTPQQNHLLAALPASDYERLAPHLELIPLKRPAAPREIGLLAVYLASDASAFMTGETVVIDGGELSRGNGM